MDANVLNGGEPGAAPVDICRSTCQHLSRLSGLSGNGSSTREVVAFREKGVFGKKGNRYHRIFWNVPCGKGDHSSCSTASQRLLKIWRAYRRKRRFDRIFWNILEGLTEMLRFLEMDREGLRRGVNVARRGNYRMRRLASAPGGARPHTVPHTPPGG